MEESEKSDNFKYNRVFESILYNIKGKKDLSETSKIYIEWAKELFQNVTKSLDSMVDISEDNSYHFTSHLKEIIKCFEKKLPKTSQEVIELKEKFSLVLNNLDNLKKDPHKFYKTKDSEEMLGLIGKLSPIYYIRTSAILS